MAIGIQGRKERESEREREWSGPKERRIYSVRGRREGEGGVKGYERDWERDRICKGKDGDSMGKNIANKKDWSIKRPIKRYQKWKKQRDRERRETQGRGKGNLTFKASHYIACKWFCQHRNRFILLFLLLFANSTKIILDKIRGDTGKTKYIICSIVGNHIIMNELTIGTVWKYPMTLSGSEG